MAQLRHRGRRRALRDDRDLGAARGGLTLAPQQSATSFHAAGGIAGLAGAAFGPVELLIAAGVVVLAAVIAAPVRAHGWWVPVVAALFGAAHGHAHGAELPAGPRPVAYVAGFVVATVALHLAGTAAGLGLPRVPLARIATGALITLAAAPLLVAA
jgi:urease accessory protein